MFGAVVFGNITIVKIGKKILGGEIKMKPENKYTKEAVAHIVEEQIDGLFDGKYDSLQVKDYLTRYILVRLGIGSGRKENAGVECT